MEVKNIPVSASSSSSSSSSSLSSPSSSSSTSSSRDKVEPIGLPDGISRRFSRGLSSLKFGRI